MLLIHFDTLTVPELASILMPRSKTMGQKLGRRKQAFTASRTRNHLVGWRDR